MLNSNLWKDVSRTRGCGFVVVADSGSFLGLVSTINSIILFHPGVSIFVVDNTLNGMGLSEAQMSAIRSAGAKVVSADELTGGGAAIAPRALKVCAIATLLARFEALVAIDAGCLLCQPIDDVILRALETEKFLGGKSVFARYDDPFRVYGIEAPAVNYRCISTSLCVVPRCGKVLRTVQRWACACIDISCSSGSGFPGDDDHDVLNAILFSEGGGERVEVLNNSLWSQNNCYWQTPLLLVDGVLLNGILQAPQRALHCSDGPKYWEDAHRERLKQQRGQTGGFSWFLTLLWCGTCKVDVDLLGERRLQIHKALLDYRVEVEAFLRRYEFTLSIDEFPSRVEEIARNVREKRIPTRHTPRDIAVTIASGEKFSHLAKYGATTCANHTKLPVFVLGEEEVFAYGERAAVYLKYKLFELFPDAENILYFDGDVLFLQKFDVASFFDREEFVCVADRRTPAIDEEAEFGGLHPSEYFNAGLFIANRTHHMRMFEMADLFPRRCEKYFYDQTAFNSARSHSGVPLCFLPKEYNFIRFQDGISSDGVVVAHFNGISQSPLETSRRLFQYWVAFSGCGTYCDDPLARARIKPGVYKYTRVGECERLVMFSTDGLIDSGAESWEMRWDAGFDNAIVLLWIIGKMHPTCALTFDPAMDEWSGRCLRTGRVWIKLIWVREH